MEARVWIEPTLVLHSLPMRLPTVEQIAYLTTKQPKQIAPDRYPVHNTVKPAGKPGVRDNTPTKTPATPPRGC